MAESGERGREEEEVAAGSGWRFGMECIHDTNADFILQGKSYIMGQAIERKWKQNKDKESNGATHCSVWKGQPSEICTGPEGEMAQFEELSVAILEKAEGGRRYWNKVAFLQFNSVIQRTTYRHTYNSAQFWAPNIIFSVFLVYIESKASAASLALFAAELVSSEDRVSNIRGTSLEIGGGVAVYFCRNAFFRGEGGGGELPRTCRNPLPQLLIAYPKIDKLKSYAMTLIYFICLLQRP